MEDAGGRRPWARAASRVGEALMTLSAGTKSSKGLLGTLPDAPSPDGGRVPRVRVLARHERGARAQQRGARMRAARTAQRAAQRAYTLACRSGEDLDATSKQSSVGRAGVRQPMSSTSANGALCGPSAVQCQPRALCPQADT
jgi:hypothetical protein